MWNVAVFVVLLTINAVCFLFKLPWFGMVLDFVTVPSSFAHLAVRPWTLLTYMFVHYDLWHILFNMLWLYWLGRIFLEFCNPKQLVALYLLGGWGGALLYMVAYNVLPAFVGTTGFLLGASASVLAIAVAVAVYAPDYKINLLFFGEVALKWIVIVTLVLDMLSIGVENSGGHIAHVGGALVGMWYGMSLRRGHDITAWLNAIIDRLVTFVKKMRYHKRDRQRAKGVDKPFAGQAFNNKRDKSKNNKSTASAPNNPDSTPTEEEIDIILDKLKRSGYGGLTDDEKATLFKASRKRVP